MGPGMIRLCWHRIELPSAKTQDHRCGVGIGCPARGKSCLCSRYYLRSCRMCSNVQTPVVYVHFLGFDDMSTTAQLPFFIAVSISMLVDCVATVAKDKGRAARDPDHAAKPCEYLGSSSRPIV